MIISIIIILILFIAIITLVIINLYQESYSAENTANSGLLCRRNKLKEKRIEITMNNLEISSEILYSRYFIQLMPL